VFAIKAELRFVFVQWAQQTQQQQLHMRVGKAYATLRAHAQSIDLLILSFITNVNHDTKRSLELSDHAYYFHPKRTEHTQLGFAGSGHQ